MCPLITREVSLLPHFRYAEVHSNVERDPSYGKLASRRGGYITGHTSYPLTFHTACCLQSPLHTGPDNSSCYCTCINALKLRFMFVCVSFGKFVMELGLFVHLLNELSTTT
jgi:hypothetical protein